MAVTTAPVELLENRRLMSVTLPPIHLPGTDTTLLVPLFTAPGNLPVTRQGPVNGDFSQFPDLTGWQTTGNDTVQDATFHSIPDGKGTQADLSNSQQPNSGVLPVGAASVESFLNLTAGSLSAPGKAAFNGSAIKQNVTAKGGDIITFKADFLTNEAANAGKDYAFVTVTLNGKTQLFKLNGALKATNPLDNTGLVSETGYHTYAIVLPKNGQYTLGYGVVNVGDTTLASNLLIENVQLKPRIFDFGDLFDHFAGNCTWQNAGSLSSGDAQSLFSVATSVLGR